jgi:hypothetical protein
MGTSKNSLGRITLSEKWRFLKFYALKKDKNMVFLGMLGSF